MEDNKLFGTRETKLDEGYIDKRHIEGSVEHTARFLYDELAKLDKTVAIRLEYLANE